MSNTAGHVDRCRSLSAALHRQRPCRRSWRDNEARLTGLDRVQERTNPAARGLTLGAARSGAPPSVGQSEHGAMGLFRCHTRMYLQVRTESQPQVRRSGRAKPAHARARTVSTDTRADTTPSLSQRHRNNASQPSPPVPFPYLTTFSRHCLYKPHHNSVKHPIFPHHTLSPKQTVA